MQTARELEIGGYIVRPGEKKFYMLDICMMGDGHPLSLPVHAIVGTAPGPRVTLLACQHGDELSTIGPLMDVIRMLQPAELRGSVCAVPIANPIAFEHGHRSTWIDSLFGDGGNMNRVWPGNEAGWVTDHLVDTLRRELVDVADYVIDLHDGNVGSPELKIYYTYYYQTPGTYGEILRKLSFNFGQEMIVRVPVEKWPSYRRTTIGRYCFEKQTPFLSAEIGEFWGFSQLGDTPAKALRTATEAGRTGILNTLKYLQMIDGEPVLPKRQLVVMPETHVRPRNAGLLFSSFDRRHVGTVMPKDTVLGRLISPYTLEEIEVLRAPHEVNCLIATTDSGSLDFSRVHPGGYGYLCADFATAEWVTH